MCVYINTFMPLFSLVKTHLPQNLAIEIFLSISPFNDRLIKYIFIATDHVLFELLSSKCAIKLFFAKVSFVVEWMWSSKWKNRNSRHYLVVLLNSISIGSLNGRNYKNRLVAAFRSHLFEYSLLSSSFASRVRTFWRSPTCTWYFPGIFYDWCEHLRVL